MPQPTERQERSHSLNKAQKVFRCGYTQFSSICTWLFRDANFWRFLKVRILHWQLGSSFTSSGKRKAERSELVATGYSSTYIWFHLVSCFWCCLLSKTFSFQQHKTQDGLVPCRAAGHSFVGLERKAAVQREDVGSVKTTMAKSYLLTSSCTTWSLNIACHDPSSSIPVK